MKLQQKEDKRDAVRMNQCDRKNKGGSSPLLDYRILRIDLRTRKTETTKHFIVLSLLNMFKIQTPISLLLSFFYSAAKSDTNHSTNKVMNFFNILNKLIVRDEINCRYLADDAVDRPASSFKQ